MEYRFKLINLSLILFSALMFASCGEETLVGSDIVSEDEITVDFRDDINITAKTIAIDSLIIYESDAVVSPGRLLLGELNDPNFGNFSSELVSQVRLSGVSFPIYYDSNPQFDSLVLILSLLGQEKAYGSTEPQTFEVYKLDEELDVNSDYSSNREAVRGMDLVGELTTVVNYDSIAVYFPIVDSIAPTFPQIRIPLSDALGEMINSDTLANSSSELLEDIISGLVIKTTDGSNAMHIIEMSTSSLAMYYKTDTLTTLYNYPLGLVRYNKFERETSGTPVESFVNDLNLGDSLLFVEGGAGYDVELDLADILRLKDSIFINNAELEFTVASEQQDTTLFPFLENIIASNYNVEGELEIISDVALALGFGDLETVFGGNIFDDFDGLTRLNKYKINITSFLKAVIDGDQDSRLVISALVAKENAGRVVLYGPKHSSYPLKLNLTYTVP